MGNNSFLFNLEWYNVLLDYPEEVRFEVYEAIMRYASTGTLSELKPLAKMAFSFIKKEIDYNREKYNDTIEKRRAAGVKSAEVKKLRKEQSEQTELINQQNQHELTQSTYVSDVQQNQHKATNSTDNDNVYVNDNIYVNDIIKDNIIKEKIHKREKDELKAQFETFRKKYPGKKRGLDTEYSNFQKRHKDWREVIPILDAAVEAYIAQMRGQPQQYIKHLQTWLNNRCWEDEYPEPTAQLVPTTNTRDNGTIDKSNRQAEIARLVAAKLARAGTREDEPDITGYY